MTKDTISHTNPQKIKEIQFGLFSAQDVVGMSEFEFFQRDMYAFPGRQPVAHGPLDRRLGVTDKGSRCETCGEGNTTCVGHYAYIKLTLPVFHPGYFKHVIAILQDICKTCARVLLDEGDRRKYLKRFRSPHLENLTRQVHAKAVNLACRKVVYCPYCFATNGTVKKAPGAILKILHEKFRAKRTQEEYAEWKNTFKSAIGDSRELEGMLGKAHEDLNPLKVLDLFKRISAEDCELLGLRPDQGRPEEFIWQYLSVPPVCIRPSVQQDGASNEDDISVKLQEMATCCAVIKLNLFKGGSTSLIMQAWEALQLTVAMYVNSELPGLQAVSGSKPVRGFCQRLKGKQGRFRGNLSGKRVDFSGRTVISPDPNLRIDEVAVPERVAKILTFPERVTIHNIAPLKQAVLNGVDVHPGANYIISVNDGFKKYLKFGSRVHVAENLKIGDTVERHIVDGDIVLFNRQPSLHKLSIMCHRVSKVISES